MLEKPTTPPNNHLAMAIISTLLCCQPLGIVSIVYASQVNSKFIAGDYIGAEQASKNAKTWWIVSLAVAAIGYLFIFAIYGIGFFLAFVPDDI
ncbi:CD225/dispanin family protein [Psychroflexus halocasei]|uniref:Interferon-induced transmembrane protein n=1 Tax=Psychroflexus halocasei TaxID=908615 RepID=A0A1H3YP64_9FLAO|nr:CD225/dispanin family protein [Psychroflexus halocasei]SEA12802.1 Interferon-induced transmembrane protein [Psychroflexus halocasei]